MLIVPVAGNAGEFKRVLLPRMWAVAVNAGESGGLGAPKILMLTVGHFRECRGLWRPGCADRCTGVLLLQENAPPQDPTVGLCLGS